MLGDPYGSSNAISQPTADILYDGIASMPECKLLLDKSSLITCTGARAITTGTNSTSQIFRNSANVGTLTTAISNKMTVVMWLNCTSYPDANGAGLMSHYSYNTAGGGGWFLGMYGTGTADSDNGYRLASFVSSNSTATSDYGGTTTAAIAGIPSLVILRIDLAASGDSNKLKIMSDNVDRPLTFAGSAGSFPANFQDTTQPLEFGRVPGFDGSYKTFDGVYGPCMILNKVLSDNECTAIWNSGTPLGINETIAAISNGTTNIVSLWPMKEKSGTRFDFIGNVNLSEVNGPINSVEVILKEYDATPRRREFASPFGYGRLKQISATNVPAARNRFQAYTVSTTHDNIFTETTGAFVCVLRMHDFFTNEGFFFSVSGYNDEYIIPGYYNPSGTKYVAMRLRNTELGINGSVYWTSFALQTDTDYVIWFQQDGSGWRAWVNGTELTGRTNTAPGSETLWVTHFISNQELTSLAGLGYGGTNRVTEYGPAVFEPVPSDAKRERVTTALKTKYGIA